MIRTRSESGKQPAAAPAQDADKAIGQIWPEMAFGGYPNGATDLLSAAYKLVLGDIPFQTAVAARLQCELRAIDDTAVSWLALATATSESGEMNGARTEFQ